VHRTLHCAMSGAPAAARYKSIFLCAVRWLTGQLLCAVRCASDRHCRLSGAPISRFKKKASSPTEPEAPLFPSRHLFLSVPRRPSGDSQPRRRPPLSGHRLPVLRRPGALVFFSGEQLLLTLTPSQFPTVLQYALFSTFCKFFKFL
jgi:hypothetical protein